MPLIITAITSKNGVILETEQIKVNEHFGRINLPTGRPLRSSSGGSGLELHIGHPRSGTTCEGNLYGEKTVEKMHDSTGPFGLGTRVDLKIRRV